MILPTVMPPHSIPVYLKILATIFLLVVFSVYWLYLGPDNFLWGSDIALFITTIALWRENRYLASMMAVGVLMPELFWNMDFFIRLLTGSHLFGLDATSYMFMEGKPLLVRGISFMLHIYLPIILIWMIIRLGYHPKAWLAQVALCWIILPLTYLLTDPVDNINWVFGPPTADQAVVPNPSFLLILMVLFPVAIYLPTHLVLARFFAKN
jgi:hypothetical protein